MTDDPIDGDTGVALEAPNGIFGLRAVVAVDRNRVTLAVSEVVLGSVGRPPRIVVRIPDGDVERVPGVWADDAIHGEAVGRLETLDGALDLAAVDPGPCISEGLYTGNEGVNVI